MASNFPSTLTAYTNPQATDRLNSPSHSGIETNQNSGISAVETFIGTLSSVQGTLMYDVRAAASHGGGHVQSAPLGGTGQTTYTKGDTLSASGPAALSKLGVGPDGAIYTADSTQTGGVTWKTGQITISSFLSSSIWTKPNGLQLAVIEAWGAGGSGGRNNNTSGGGGGGGGTYTIGRYPASLLGTTELVIIGAGGIAVTGNSNGNSGAITVFGSSSLLTAYGGGGGGGNSVANPGGGGGGGGMMGTGSSGAGAGWGPGGRPSPSVLGQSGDNSMGGANGSNDSGTSGFAVYGGGGGGSGNSTTGGLGGNSLYGGGGGAGAGGSGSGGTGGTSRFGGGGGIGGGTTTPSAGTQPGGGGGGAFDENSGAGADGKIVVYEYY